MVSEMTWTQEALKGAYGFYRDLEICFGWNRFAIALRAVSGGINTWDSVGCLLNLKRIISPHTLIKLLRSYLGI